MHPDFRRTPRASLLASALAIGPVAIGCGVGLLLADRVRGGSRHALASGLFSLGALAALPLMIDYASKTLDHPRSARGSQRRIERIRDSGAFPDADGDAVAGILGGEEYFLDRESTAV